MTRYWIRIDGVEYRVYADIKGDFYWEDGAYISKKIHLSEEGKLRVYSKGVV